MVGDTSSDSWIVFEFTDRFLDDASRGEVRSLEQYLALFPGRDEAIRAEYDELVRAQAARAATRRLGPYRLLRELGSGGQARVWLAEDTQLGRKVALKVLSAALVGASRSRRERFRREAALVARLEHPGLCAVLDTDLDGELPWIAMRYVDGPTLASVLREEREAWEADGADLARHPVHGAKLAERLILFERVARALHAAHEAGVVHRDVKPGNVMVASDGSPVLLDFGLAYDESDDEVITRSGEVFGTPAYMAPEQLDGTDVDRRTDVYALGVVAYEALTLRRPVGGGSSDALARAIRQDVPRDAHALNPRLPRDVSVVLATALEKEPSRRYATALDLAEELRRVREFEPIRARPIGAWGRLTRWARRNPGLASATLGSIVLLSLALITALVFIRELRDERNARDVALAEKEAAQKLLEGAWYRDLSAERLETKPRDALRLAVEAAERDPGLASNTALLRALDGLRERTSLTGHTGQISEVDVDPTGAAIVTSSQDGTVRLWDAASGATRATWRADGAAVWCVRFDPRGERIAAACADGVVRVWDRNDPAREALRLAGHASDVNWVEFDSTGARLVSASRDHTARVWDARTGALLHELRAHTGNVSEAHFLDHDRHVVTSSANPLAGSAQPESDDALHVFDVATGACVADLLEHRLLVRGVEVHPDGRRFVSTSEDGSARLWDLADLPSDGRRVTLASRHVLQVEGYLAAASFHPDGHRLAVSGERGARVVDVDTFDTLYELPTHDHRAVVDVAYDPEGRYLATTAFDNTVRVFHGSSPEQLVLCRGVPVRPRGVRWAAGGAWLLSWHTTSEAIVWYGRARPFLGILDPRAGPVRTARFDPSGTRVLLACEDGSAPLFDVATGARVAVLAPTDDGSPRTPLVAADFDPSGSSAFLYDRSGGVSVARVDGSGATCRVAGAADAPEPVFLAGDERLWHVAVGGEPEIAFLDARPPVRLVGGLGRVVSACVSEDGAWCLVGTDARTVHAWSLVDARPGTAVAPRWSFGPYETSNHRLQSVYAVALSSDGRYAAAATQSQLTILFDARDGRVLAQQPSATVGQVRFARGSSRLLAAGKWLGFLLQYDVAPAADSAMLVPAQGEDPQAAITNGSCTRLVVAHGGEWIGWSSLDRRARLWDVARQRWTNVYTGHDDAVWDLDVSPDDATIVTASQDGTARLWPVDVLAAARRVVTPP